MFDVVELLVPPAGNSDVVKVTVTPAKILSDVVMPNEGMNELIAINKDSKSVIFFLIMKLLSEILFYIINLLVYSLSIKT